MLSDSPEERDTGVVPPDNDLAPFPTVILSSGVNLSPGKMSWLAAHLAADGYTVVTYRLVGEEMPGHVTLTPGFDLDALRPENLDSRPSGIAYGPIIEELKQLNRKGLLKGLIDVEHIIFGGHSAGGSAALMNASKKWFEGICAAFSYGAHTGVATILGHPPNSVVPISPMFRYCCSAEHGMAASPKARGVMAVSPMLPPGGLYRPLKKVSGEKRVIAPWF